MDWNFLIKRVCLTSDSSRIISSWLLRKIRSLLSDTSSLRKMICHERCYRRKMWHLRNFLNILNIHRHILLNILLIRRKFNAKVLKILFWNSILFFFQIQNSKNFFLLFILRFTDRYHHLPFLPSSLPPSLNYRFIRTPFVKLCIQHFSKLSRNPGNILAIILNKLLSTQSSNGSLVRNFFSPIFSFNVVL